MMPRDRDPHKMRPGGCAPGRSCLPAQAHIVLGDAGLQLLLRGQLRMGRGRRMDGEAAGVADVGDVVEQPERVDEAPAGLAAAPQFESDQAAIAAPQVGVGTAAELAALLARMDDPGHRRMLDEVVDDGLDVAGMLADA